MRTMFGEIDVKKYGAIPFWSWNNELSEPELRKQINDMKAVGMGGFIMHARQGLKTKYLSEEWFACVGACLDEAKKLNMSAWIYDENGWPSGFVGGELLKTEEYRANYLEYQIKDSFDTSAYAVYRLDGGVATRLKEGETADKYHCIYLKTSPANTDILNPKVVDEFISRTHEEYYKRFKSSFGRELAGFFTDEPQYYRISTPFTRIIIDEYKKKYGGDVLDYLVYLFIESSHGHEFRYRYYCMLCDLYTHNFYKRLFDWCGEHGCKLTGHSIEESTLSGQMLGGANVMPSYEFQHIPGVDYLSRNCRGELSFKQVASVSAQLGKEQILTETFGCAGYDATPFELKSNGDHQYFNGVNFMCHHLYPYSIASQGKYDHPPVFSKHSGWWEGFREFNDYFTKLGYIIANTDEIVDAAVISPMREVYLSYIRTLDEKSVKDIEDSYNKLLLSLRNNGILYHIIDETILERHGKAMGGKLIVGKKAYGSVILPDMKVLSSFTENSLKEFVSQGGELFKSGSLPSDNYLKAGLSEQVFITARKGKIGEFLFVKNLSPTDCGYAKIEGLEDYVLLDIASETESRAPSEVHLQPNGSAVFLKKKCSKPAKKLKNEQDLTDKLKFLHITDNYLVIDKAQISYDGKAYGVQKDVQCIFEELLRADFKGELYVKFLFNVKHLPSSLTLMIERADYRFVEINGNKLKLSGSDFDVNFAEADILPYVKKGGNEIVYKIAYSQHEGVSFALFHPEATESLRNCLSYDTEIERIYLKGGFSLDGDLNICKKITHLPVSGKLNTLGLPFFYGKVTYLLDFEYTGGAVEIALSGRYMFAEVKANGKSALAVLSNTLDITGILKRGLNSIEITLSSSLRNLLGPHHFYRDTENGVSPYCFTVRGSWANGESKDYVPAYNTVGFGLSGVTVKEYEV